MTSFLEKKEKRRGQLLKIKKSKLCAVFVSFKHVMKVFCILCGLLIFHVKLFLVLYIPIDVPGNIFIITQKSLKKGSILSFFLIPSWVCKKKSSRLYWHPWSAESSLMSNFCHRGHSTTTWTKVYPIQMADSKKLSLSKPPILNIFSWKFQGLVLGSVGKIDAMAQQIWMPGCLS